MEYDDVEWQRREWISVYRDNLFHLFLVEQALVWADRRDPFSHGTVLWPALVSHLYLLKIFLFSPDICNSIMSIFVIKNNIVTVSIQRGWFQLKQAK